MFEELNMAEVAVVDVFRNECADVDGTDVPEERAPLQVGSAQQVAKYAATAKRLAPEEKVDSWTVSALRKTRPGVDWTDIPDDLNIGRGIVDISDEQLNKLAEVIRQQSKEGLFATTKNPGQVSPGVALHRIDTGEARPVNLPPRRMP